MTVPTRNAKHFGDFGIGKLLYVAQPDRFAETSGSASSASWRSGPITSRINCSSAVAAGSTGAARSYAIAVDLNRVAPAVPPAVAERVVEDREQPGLQIGAWLELLRRSERLDIGVLHEVLRIGLVARQTQRGPIEAVEMAERVGLEPRPRPAIARESSKHARSREYTGCCAPGSVLNEPQHCVSLRPKHVNRHETAVRFLNEIAAPSVVCNLLLRGRCDTRCDHSKIAVIYGGHPIDFTR